ncbi:MAG: hypothetical protein IKP77_03835 [Acholeplasmatales bacterium]|nr:hypothetical protein [Acholeplasmatales bacterium]
MKNIAYSYRLPIVLVLLLLLLLGGILAIGIIKEILYLILISSFFIVFIVALYIYLNLIRKNVLLSCDDEGIIIHKMNKDIKYKWYEIGKLDFNKAHNRYMSFDFYGTLIIGTPNNKIIKLYYVRDIKSAYDRLVESKQNHFSKVNN